MYALLTHATELALKAYALHSVGAGPTKNKPPGNHDLVGWYILAVSYGLENEPTISKGIGFLNELHETHFMRYPTRPSGPIPNPETIADQTVDHLIFAVMCRPIGASAGRARGACPNGAGLF